MTTTYARYLLPHIADMAPYTPIVPFEVLSARLGRAPEEIVKLDANENPYGPHPAVREALAAYPFPHIYPDPEQHALRDALAEYVGVPAANIFPGHGADELIDLICRIFLGPGDAIINCPPTFGMYEFDAGLADAEVIQVRRRADFSVDVERVVMECGSVGVRECGSVGVRECGSVGVQECGSVGVRECGSVGVQECGSVGVQECGSVGVQECGSVGVQECGSVGVRECGSVGVRECGSVGVRECGSVGVQECGSVGVLADFETPIPPHPHTPTPPTPTPRHPDTPTLPHPQTALPHLAQQPRRQPARAGRPAAAARSPADRRAG